ncbi:MAG: hypothetical protein C0433_16260 [Cyclobacterium sp.]|nr:hypothetical protein [Cyclobacterium sp.]
MGFIAVLSELILDLGTKGLFVEMSAGNVDNQTSSNQSSQNFPGCINGPNVFTIGSNAFDYNGFTAFSPYGKLGVPSVNWMAPGENVFSTFPGNQYATMSGISMAAALVAGLIHSKGGIPSAIRNESFNGVIYPFAGR